MSDATNVAPRDSYPGSSGLLPCPFCGANTVKLHEYSHAGMAWVACGSCGLEAPTETGVTADKAVEYWNTRAPQPGVRAQGSPEISHHIGWIKLYVEGMTVDNWRDMKLRAERQLEQLSDAVAQPKLDTFAEAMAAIEDAKSALAQGAQEAREKEITRLATIAECASLCDGLRRKDYSSESADWIAGTLDCATAIRGLSLPSTEGK